MTDTTIAIGNQAPMIYVLGCPLRFDEAAGLEAQGQPSAGEARPLAGCKALVIEDEAAQALDLECSLQGLGCKVLGPTSATAEAIDLLRRERPSLVLHDLILQDGDALPVAERLLALGLPFALLTGQDGVLLDHPALRGVPCLRKPYSAAELRRCVPALYRLDLLRKLARIEAEIAKAEGRIACQTRRVERVTAHGRRTCWAEGLRQNVERALAILAWPRGQLLDRLQQGDQRPCGFMLKRP
jgi:CheY-like chemotaxis protein